MTSWLLLPYITSLINVDIKILSKIVAMSLAKLLPVFYIQPRLVLSLAGQQSYALGRLY